MNFGLKIKPKKERSLCVYHLFRRRHDIQHSNTQDNDTRHNDTSHIITLSICKLIVRIRNETASITQCWTLQWSPICWVSLCRMPLEWVSWRRSSKAKMHQSQACWQPFKWKRCCRQHIMMATFKNICNYFFNNKGKSHCRNFEGDGFDSRPTKAKFYLIKHERKLCWRGRR